MISIEEIQLKTDDKTNAKSVTQIKQKTGKLKIGIECLRGKREEIPLQIVIIVVGLENMGCHQKNLSSFYLRQKESVQSVEDIRINGL